MVEISTSFLSVEKDKVMQAIYNLEVAKTDYYHIDVMDGKFVESFTNEIMEEYSGYMKSVSSIPLDVHLMVNDVKKYVDIYLNYDPSIITFHIEAVKDKEETMKLINYIKSNNCKVGLSINPSTPVQKLYELLPYIHLVLVMTVVPGKGGQELIESTIDKIKELRAYIDDNNYDVYIEADGGIKLENCNLVKDAGADILVSGTGIIKQENYAEAIKQMRR